MNTITIRLIDATSGTLIQSLEWPQVPPPGAGLLLQGRHYRVLTAIWQESAEVEVGRNKDTRRCAVELSVTPI